MPDQEDIGYTIARRVSEILKTNCKDLLSSNDIRVEDYPLSNKIGQGIVVMPVDEQDAGGLNNADDVRYRTQLVRVKNNVNNSQETQPRSVWRNRIRDLFHNKQIGLSIPGADEIITKVRFGTLLDRRQIKNKREMSYMVIETLMREARSEI